MNNEIKEILIKDFNEILVKEFCTDWKEKRLYIELLVNSTPFSNLLDYITNLQSKIDTYELFDNQKIAYLQEENERLKEENKKLETTLNTWAEAAKDEEKRKYEFMGRNKKAIGIANERINYCYHENDKEQLESWEEIFDTLQGIDENE